MVKRQLARLKRWLQTISDRSLVMLALELLLALVCGQILIELGMGQMSWLLGAAIAAIVVFHPFKSRAHPPNPKHSVRKIGQACVGYVLGASLASKDFSSFASELPLLALLAGFTLLSGTCVGYIYSRLHRIDLFTALLSTIPGALWLVVGIASEYNKNVAQITAVQITRLTVIVLLLPLVANVSLAHLNRSASLGVGNYFQLSGNEWLMLGSAGGLAWLGFRLAQGLRIPVSSFIGPICIGVLFKLIFGLIPAFSEVSGSPPQLLTLIGQILLGVTIGEAWARQSASGTGLLLQSLLPVGLTIAFGLLAAVIVMGITTWNWLTCLLLTSPGGASEIVLITLALDVEHTEIIAAGHLVRLLVIIAGFPLWMSWFHLLERHLSSSDRG